MRIITSAFITGATGVVGTALVHQLAQQGIAVTVLMRKDSSRRANLPQHENIHVLDGDVAALHEISNLPACDAFFHLAWMGTTGAARNDMRLQHENVRCTLDAVDLSERLGCKVFVFAGSQAEYGRVEGKLSAHTPANPENGYGMAKLCAAQMSRGACQQKGIAHVHARILSIYGPCDGPNTLVSSIIRDLLHAAEPHCSAGEQMWDYLYGADAANALWLMAQRGQDGAVYPVGSGVAKPLRECMLAIRDAVNPALPIGIGKRPYVQNQVMHLQADITQLTQDTGFVPQISFDEGIKATVEWMRKHGE